MAVVRSAGLVLKSVRSIAVSICPFESNVQSARKFLEVVNAKHVRTTNNNCKITVDVRHDKSEPSVNIEFVDGERLLIKTANITAQEMVQKLSALCLSKDRVKEAPKK